MMHLVFMLEEPSIGEVLKIILPAIVHDAATYQLIPHEGKHDLEKSIPRKLRAWRSSNARFVIVRDQDSAECHALKRRLGGLCAHAGRSDSLVRIVCPHLESWFLGDLAAVEKAFDRRGFAKRQLNRKFRNPDALANAEQELKKLIPTYQKISGSRAIAPHLSLSSNQSRSFKNFISGVQALVKTAQEVIKPEMELMQKEEIGVQALSKTVQKE